MDLRRQFKLSLTTPNPNQHHFIGGSEVDDTERRMDALSDMVRLEFGNHSPGIGIVSQYLEIFQNSAYEPVADVGHAFIEVISLNRSEILKRGMCNS